MIKYINKILLYSFFLFISMSFYSCQEFTANVSADFLKKKEVNSMVGFLHFRDLKTLEPTLKQLKPKYWRFRYQDTSVQDVEFLKQNGVTPILVLSDAYGYPQNLGKNWKSPLNSNNYKNTTKDIYLKLGNTVIYDLWNEPYHEAFGKFKNKDFYQLFKQTHDVIRSLPGGDKAIITGPSFDHYNEKDIEGFLKFCADNKIRVDVLSWHDWRYGDELTALKNDIAKVRNVMLPKYPSVGVKEIIFSEIIHKFIQFSPSQIYQLYDTLEKSNLDGACRSCWEESDGVINCEKNSMGGLLDQTGKPRSVWWATKLYAQSTENRVESKTDNSGLTSFAFSDQKGAHLLLANSTKNAIKKTNIDLMNLSSLPIFKNRKNVKINIYKIPATGEKPLADLIFVSAKTVSFSDELLTNVPEIDSGQVFYISLNP